MRIKAVNSFLDFQFVAVELEHYPSLALSIEVACEGFTGFLQEVWFRLSDLELFVRQLETLERSRQGEVRLIQMSDESEYCPFRLRIFSTDRVGYMAISAEMTRTSYIGNHSLLFANKLSVTFEIDAGMLSTILQDFKEVFAQRSQ